VQSRDNTDAVYFSMNESDVKLACGQPWVSVNNDASGVNPEGPLGESKTHPLLMEPFRASWQVRPRRKNLTSLTPSAIHLTPAQRMSCAIAD